ncbi:MAG TPA: type II toxin-antitoxin system RelE/ParE family toxin [Longimicrobiaceae bacterium]|nr:type II toxin-antitoxin system RelE/ParE family toxin [Longimicrobiaceae bacterium]
MISVTPLRSAQADIRRAARFYEGEAPGLGAEFVSEIEHVFVRLGENPEIGTPMRRGARKLLVRRFPYVVIYRIEPERVLVLAAGHQRRHPDFWIGRA